jgi:hypothetical protein
MADQRRGGTISLNRNGVSQECKGNFTFNLGFPKREALMGSSGILGYKETPQVAFIEGEIVDRGDLSIADLVQAADETITLELATGKVVMLRGAWYAGEGTGNTEEGNIGVRFESKQQGEEVT